jgi:hypothetical protein
MTITKIIVKKILVFSFVMSTVVLAHAGISSARYIKQEQARNYIEHVVQSLFMPSLHAHSYVQELDAFIANITERLLKQEAFIGKKTGTFYYKALVLCDKLLPEILDFIYEKSKLYAQQELVFYKKYISSTQESALVDSVAKKIRNQAFNILYYADPLPAGPLMKYMGAPLRKKVTMLVKEQAKRYSA